MQNETLIQYFEWYLPAGAGFWKFTAAEAKRLAALGITAAWLPPAYKGQAGVNDVGYGVYDLYDLGEFDQRGSVPTKYGTREEYIAAVKALHKAGVQAWADVVLNHRMGADATEQVLAQDYAQNNRTQPIREPQTITAWTKFTFPGRNKKYSDFEWDASCFSGVDWDEAKQEKGVFRFANKAWKGGVDDENGNYDYLMGADLDTSNPQVVEELDRWGKWYADTVDFDGIRIDAAKHIPYTFFTHWLQALRTATGKELPAVGEYWHQDLTDLIAYLDNCGQVMRLFDVPLHFQFHNLSQANGALDLRALFSNSLAKERPQQAVTFVDNHDTQPGQALASWVNAWCKPLAYACILLRQEGLPCVFYGDLYGIPHDNAAPVAALPRLLLARKYCAYGEQVDYLDNPDSIGWVRVGDEEHAESGMAVVLTDGGETAKTMCVGARFAGQVFVDCLGGRSEQIEIPANGTVAFPVNGGGVSVWVSQAAAQRIITESE